MLHMPQLKAGSVYCMKYCMTSKVQLGHVQHFDVICQDLRVPAHTCYMSLLTAASTLQPFKNTTQVLAKCTQEYQGMSKCHSPHLFHKPVDVSLHVLENTIQIISKCT